MTAQAVFEWVFPLSISILGLVGYAVARMRYRQDETEQFSTAPHALPTPEAELERVLRPEGEKARKRGRHEIALAMMVRIVGVVTFLYSLDRSIVIAILAGIVVSVHALALVFLFYGNHQPWWIPTVAALLLGDVLLFLLIVRAWQGRSERQAMQRRDKEIN
jgi:hypothetical protein